MSQESIDAARALMPLWIGWVSFLWLPAVSFLVSASLLYLGARVALFRAEGLSSISWTERARASYPARRARSMLFWMCAGFLIAFLNDQHNPLIHVTLVGVAALSFGFAILADAIVARVIAKRLGDPIVSLPRWTKQFITLWLQSSWWLVLALLIFAMPSTLGIDTIALITVGLIVVLYANLIGMPRLLHLIGLARSPSPALAAAVKEASEKMGLTPHAVYELDIASANAFALPIPRHLVFTQRALEVLDHQQLVAVCCHEIAHLAEPPRVKTLRVASNFLFLLLCFINPVYSRFGEEGFLILVAIVLFASLRVIGMRRRMETRADTAAHQHESDQGVYAAALEQIYRASNLPAVISSKRHAHGDLYDRMLAAGVTPTYPRPSPPAKAPVYVSLGLCLALLLGFAIGFDVWLPSSARRANRLTETGIMWRLAVGAANAPTFARLGDIRLQGGHVDQAATLYECATEMAPYSLIYRTKLAIAYSRLGRCADADELISDAASDLEQWGPGAKSAWASEMRVAKNALSNCSRSGSSDP